MNAENGHEERVRLISLLQAIESGKITHIDEGSAAAAANEPGQYRNAEGAPCQTQRSSWQR